MSIRIIAAVSNAGLVASLPSAQQGREGAFAAAWAECDVAATRAEAGGHITEAETASTQEKPSECQSESDDGDQTVSPETSADQSLDLTTPSVEPVAAASIPPALPNPPPNSPDALLATAPSLQAPQQHPVVGTARPALPSDRAMEAAEFFAEQDWSAASGARAADMLQQKAATHEIMQSDLLAVSGLQSGDEQTFIEAPMDPPPVDPSGIRGRAASANPHTNQDSLTAQATPNIETRPRAALSIEQRPTMTAWQNASDTGMREMVEPGTVGAVQTTSTPHPPTVAMDITPNSTTDEVLTSEQPSLGFDTYRSRAFPTVPGIEGRRPSGPALRWIADQASVDSAHMPLIAPAREDIKDLPAPLENKVKVKGAAQSTIPMPQATQSTATLDGLNPAAESRDKPEHDPSKNGLTHGITSTPQSEISRIELVGRYSLARPIRADIDDASRAPLDLTEISALVHSTERSSESGNSTAVAPPSSTSHSPAALAPSRQVANAIIESASSSGETELVLTPEELGTVRFTISQNDNSLTITVTVDRADTLQLLRRNMDVLTAELSQAGISGASINFGDSNRDRRATPSASSGGSAKDHDNSYSEPAPKVRPIQQRGHAGRLDLRL